MTRVCKQAGCTRVFYGRGYCNLHYKRWRKGADLDDPVLRCGSLSEAFWMRVNKGPHCWMWATAPNTQGYGQIRRDGITYLAHRVSWGLHNGDIPEGAEIDHICRNRICVNPDHLRLSTRSENAQNLGEQRRDNSSGFRGVSWFARDGVWLAKATVGKTQHYLGYYLDIDEAAEAVAAWRRENMPYSIMDKRKDVV